MAKMSKITVTNTAAKTLLLKQGSNRITLEAGKSSALPSAGTYNVVLQSNEDIVIGTVNYGGENDLAVESGEHSPSADFQTIMAKMSQITVKNTAAKTLVLKQGSNRITLEAGKSSALPSAGTYNVVLQSNEDIVIGTVNYGGENDLAVESGEHSPSADFQVTVDTVA
ncbi:hypothetical protein AMATHDRAFT_6037 [Amanita thiersii Skay4041]|uniref:Uncharacterized protein n=1 Tax=Amanita thiersii Skay4041 TaxID=703135 RepID=A0A2A9NKA1_9AGAR|nr:hypothetical protein AMATHDRAFT_6037 [Amanita thiersii Skay4041]